MEEKNCYVLKRKVRFAGDGLSLKEPTYNIDEVVTDNRALPFIASRSNRVLRRICWICTALAVKSTGLFAWHPRVQSADATIFE